MSPFIYPGGPSSNPGALPGDPWVPARSRRAIGNWSKFRYIAGLIGAPFKANRPPHEPPTLTDAHGLSHGLQHRGLTHRADPTLDRHSDANNGPLVDADGRAYPWSPRKPKPGASAGENPTPIDPDRKYKYHDLRGSRVVEGTESQDGRKYNIPNPGGVRSV
jgi:hypothetical protein